MMKKNQSENQFIFHTLPPELLIEIFKYFSPKALAILSTVSNNFNHLSNSNALWFNFFKKDMASLRIEPTWSIQKDYKNIYRDPFNEIMAKLPYSKQLTGLEIHFCLDLFGSNKLIHGYFFNCLIAKGFKENEKINLFIYYKKLHSNVLCLYVFKLFFENDAFKMHALSPEEIALYKGSLSRYNSTHFTHKLPDNTEDNFLNSLFKKIGAPLNISSREFMKNIFTNELTCDKEIERLDDFFDKIESLPAIPTMQI